MSEEFQFKPLEQKEIEPEKPKRLSGSDKIFNAGLFFTILGFSCFFYEVYIDFSDADSTKTALSGLSLGIFFGLVYLTEIGFFDKPSRKAFLENIFLRLWSLLKPILKITWFLIKYGFIFGMIFWIFTGVASLPVGVLLTIVILLLLFR